MPALKSHFKQCSYWTQWKIRGWNREAKGVGMGCERKSFRKGNWIDNKQFEWPLRLWINCHPSGTWWGWNLTSPVCPELRGCENNNPNSNILMRFFAQVKTHLIILTQLTMNIKHDNIRKEVTITYYYVNMLQIFLGYHMEKRIQLKGIRKDL